MRTGAAVGGMFVLLRWNKRGLASPPESDFTLQLGRNANCWHASIDSTRSSADGCAWRTNAQQGRYRTLATDGMDNWAASVRQRQARLRQQAQQSFRAMDRWQ